MLELKDVTFTYLNGKNNFVEIIKSINIKFLPGNISGIIGPVGSGKTTIAKICAGLLSPDKGDVVLNGIPVYRPHANNSEINSVAGMVFQNPEDQLFEETVFNDIAFAPRNAGKPEEKVDEIVDRAIESLEIDNNLLYRSPFSISKGEMRMVAIAGVIALDPEVVILDEPTSCLDNKNKNIIYKMAEILRKENKTILWISHNIEEIKSIADRILKLENKDFIEVSNKLDNSL